MFAYQKSSGDFKNVNGSKNKATIKTIMQKFKSKSVKKAFIKSWIFFEAKSRKTTPVPNKSTQINIETILLKLYF